MIRVLVIAFAVTGSPVWATQDGWPALYDVAGVEEDDVLNVREGPSTGTPVIATLPPHAEGIEVIRPNDRETWGLINIGEGTGWVSLRFMARQPGQWLGQVPMEARCFGTEPFWAISIEDDRLVLKRPDAPDAVFGPAERLRSINRIDRTAIVAGGDDGNLSVLMKLETCSDGMSDRAFGIGADVIHEMDGSALFSGCCTLSR